MRHVGGCSTSFRAVVALCALSACSGASGRPSTRSHPASQLEEQCALVEATRAAAEAASADSATIVFRGARDLCAYRLVAAALRPWPTASGDRWTVQIALTETGATALRLSGERARDAIDGGLAPLVTEDLDVVAYATARPELDVAPLPWDRTYLLLSFRAGSPLGAEHASDAVGVDARPATTLVCDTIVPVAAPPEVTSSRVVYEAGDPTARELAERVVAVVVEANATAAALRPAEFDAALRAGNELAYIVSLPRRTERECVDVTELAQRTPWLAPHAMLPLVDTRAHVVTPRGQRP